MKLFLQLQPLVICVNYPVFLLRPCFACVWEKNLSKILFSFYFRHLAPHNWKIYTEETTCHDRPYLIMHLYWPLLKSTSLCSPHRYANWPVSSFCDNCSTVNIKGAGIWFYNWQTACNTWDKTPKTRTGAAEDERFCNCAPAVTFFCMNILKLRRNGGWWKCNHELNFW